MWIHVNNIKEKNITFFGCALDSLVIINTLSCLLVNNVTSCPRFSRPTIYTAG